MRPVSETVALPELTAAELAALRGAASWYASYHAREVAAGADDQSAYAVTDRERYLALVSALRKLGVRVALPDALLRKRLEAA